MQLAKLSLHPEMIVGEVDDRLFGGFIEHLGRCIYGGVYQPDHPFADSEGLRSDLFAALAELEVSVVRYPGGNFVSGYHWENGVGPKDSRSTVRELAWKSLEPNLFGTDEFVGLCSKLNWMPMLAVNLGTGTPEEACNWVEYCNGAEGTRFADMRVANGHREPHSVPIWCLGNEMDGPWQLGHVPAEVYAQNARQAAKMMKDCDPSVQTVACGSSAMGMSTFLEWDRVVLEILGDLADYISLHRYVGNGADDSLGYLAMSQEIDAQIEAVDACARYVAAKRRSRSRVLLCFDEWNVWYRARGGVGGPPTVAPPLLEERYNFEDALVAAMFLMSFIRHADVVKIANLAQLVNVIAPIVTQEQSVLKQTIFHAFKMISTRKGGNALRCALTCDSYETASGGRVQLLDAAAMLEDDLLKVFLINRDLDNDVSVEIDMHNRRIATLRSAEILHHKDLKAENSSDQPTNVAAEPFNEWRLNQSATTTLPSQSLVAASFKVDI